MSFVQIMHVKLTFLTPDNIKSYYQQPVNSKIMEKNIEAIGTSKLTSQSKLLPSSQCALGYQPLLSETPPPSYFLANPPPTSLNLQPINCKIMEKNIEAIGTSKLTSQSKLLPSSQCALGYQPLLSETPPPSYFLANPPPNPLKSANCLSSFLPLGNSSLYWFFVNLL